MAVGGTYIPQYGILLKYPAITISEEIGNPLTRPSYSLLYYVYKDKETNKYIMYLNNAYLDTQYSYTVTHKHGYDYSERTYSMGIPKTGDGSLKKYTSADGILWDLEGIGFVYDKDEKKIQIKFRGFGDELDYMSPQPILITRPVFKFKPKEE